MSIVCARGRQAAGPDTASTQTTPPGAASVGRPATVGVLPGSSSWPPGCRVMPAAVAALGVRYTGCTMTPLGDGRWTPRPAAAGAGVAGRCRPACAGAHRQRQLPSMAIRVVRISSSRTNPPVTQEALAAGHAHRHHERLAPPSALLAAGQGIPGARWTGVTQGWGTTEAVRRVEPLGGVGETASETHSP